MDPETLRCDKFIPAAFRQYRFDIQPFQLIETLYLREDRGCGRTAPLPEGGGEMQAVDDRTFTKNESVFDDVLQLPYIAGKFVRHEQLERLFGESLYLFIVARVEPFDEVVA